MSQTERLTLNQQIIKDTKHEVERYLRNLGNYDSDFNGDNGEDCLWEDAANVGYKNNLDYVLAITSKEPDSIKRIENFVDMWLESDSEYSQYRLKIERVGNKLFTSLAFTMKMD